ncbi:MAG: GIY-YIG nuclease family protein [Thiohalocapsa sp.]|nr:GIY-YIG nuclease family protein [Thiohalocapsa sp.]MCF7991387.1 GIY-YIG nuclease family protein [Thiohalocapsa sp.]
MKYSEYMSHLQDFAKFMEARVRGFSAKETFNPRMKPFIKDWNDSNNLPVPVRGDGVGDKSGLYFIVGEDEEVLYIGKATKSNIHERVWGHIQTPKDGDKEKTKRFPNNRFKAETEREYGNIVENGEVRLGIVQICPDNATSVAEVYLQTICLPPLCKQIG